MSADKSTLDTLRIDRNARSGKGSNAPLAGFTVFIIILISGLVWWSLRAKAPSVRTATAQQVSTGGSKTLLNASGYVTARREATVSSKVTGKVVEVLIEEGRKVESGEVLARIDPSNVQASLHLAEAQWEAARSSANEIQVRLDEAERELRRVTQLSENKIATRADLDRAGSDAKAQRARLAKQSADALVAEREVALWRQQMEDTVIRAPFAGVVTVKNAQPGEMISPMSAGGSFTRTGICTIVDMNSLEIEVDVNESFINRVEAGQPVEATLDSYPDWKMPSKVIAIIPTADRQKATVKVRVGFDKLDNRILPHMGVKVAFQSADSAPSGRASVGIPKTAVQRRDGRDIVWVVRDGRVERRAVTVDASASDIATVAAGLAIGEKVIVDPPENLTDGARVMEAKP
jgi:RND family efflux transporter MFP subunit